MTVGELIKAGGPETLARHAAEKVPTFEREFRLGVLERWQRRKEPDLKGAGGIGLRAVARACRTISRATACWSRGVVFMKHS